MSHAIKPLADIACIVRVAEDTPRAALDQAFALARETGADLTVTVAAQKLATPYSPIWVSLPRSLVGDINSQTAARAEEMAGQARDAARIAGINAHVEVVFDEVGTVAVQAVMAARSADLIVVDQPQAAMDTKATVMEEALFRSGRPVMVATPKRPPSGSIRRLLVAWDGSAHAARATAEALSLFHQVEAVELVSVTGEKDLSKTLRGADFARHLARKGAATTLTELGVKGRSVAATIDGHAVSSGADLIVMGGYGHSRFREMVLGGVTLELTNSASVPLLLAY